MFPYQQMAVGLMPGALNAAYCRFCTATCCDTGNSIECLVTCGYGHSCLLGQSGPPGCGWGQSTTPQVHDPIEQLQALRKGLEVALAGVEAQEHALRKQREGGTDQKK